MAQHDGSGSFGGIPLGVLELNVFIAGVEAVGPLLVLRALFDWPPIPDLPAKWGWGLVLLGILAVLGVSILGLLVEGMAGITERIITRQGSLKEKVFLLRDGAKLRKRFATLTRHPSNWTNAQRWIWTSQQAADEYGRRRLRILVSRNTTFNAIVLTLPATGLVATNYGFLSGFAIYVLCILLVCLFGFVWIDANRAYHQAITDAGSVDHAGH